MQIEPSSQLKYKLSQRGQRGLGTFSLISLNEVISYIYGEDYNSNEILDMIMFLSGAKNKYWMSTHLIVQYYYLENGEIGY